MRKPVAAKRRPGSLALGGLLALVATVAHADANLQDIRIARHDDHVRVVLDLDAPVTFVRSGDQSFSIEGLASGSAVMNAAPRDVPLTRVVLEAEGGATRLSFETKGAARAKAFLVEPDGSNGHRLVVDLYPASASSEQKTEATAPVPVPAMTPSVPASGSMPAVAAVPAVAKAAPSPAAPEPVEATPAPAIVAETAKTEPAANLPPDEFAPQLPAFAHVAETSAPTPSVPPIVATPVIPALTEAPKPAAPVLLPPVTSAPADRAVAAERALDKGDAAAACSMAEDALRIAPQELRALAVLGWCRLAKHDAAGARTAFQSALDSDPSFHRARIGIAEAEAKLGNLAAARAEYARVLADDPPTEDAYQIIDALDALKRPVSPRGV